MKIAIDARMYGLEHSGIGRYLINLVRELQTLDERNNYYLFLRKKYYESLILPEKWKKMLADFHHYSFEEQLVLPGLIRKIHPDLVHFPHFNVPLLYHGKYVVTVHDITMHTRDISATTLLPPLYFLKRIPYKIVFKNAVKKAERIIVPSNVVQKELTSYYKIDSGKVKTIYEGFSPNFTVKGDVGELEIMTKYNLLNNDYLFYIGNAYPHKNLFRVIKTVHEYNSEEKSKILFIIAGSRDKFVDRLKQQVTRLGAQSDIRFLGYVPDDHLPVIYKNCLAFIYPSLAEGFGLQGLEAIAAGTLVVASDIPVFREVYANAVKYFDPYDNLQLKEAIKELRNLNTSERQQQIENNRFVLNKYSWTKMAKQTLEIYENCLSIRQG